MVASLMNPLGATSLVWWCTISHPVRDALIPTASRGDIKVKVQSHHLQRRGICYSKTKAT